MATKAQQIRVGKWVSHWKSKLLLDNWAILVDYRDKAAPSDTVAMETCANIVVNTRYREAQLRVYPGFFTKPTSYQRATILHEVSHIITDPVLRALTEACSRGAISAKRRDDVSEGVTEDITKIVLRLGKASKDNYRV